MAVGGIDLHRLDDVGCCQEEEEEEEVEEEATAGGGSHRSFVLSDVHHV